MEYNNLEEKTLKETLIHKGNFMEYYNVDVRLPNGKVGNRDIIRHPGASAVIAFLDDENIILVKQYRKALDRVLLEIPAGKLEKGEDPKISAERELEEETGYKAKKITYLGKIVPAPGFCDEIVYIYKATDLYKGIKSGDEDEFIDLEIVSINKLKKLIRDGEVIDAKTISLLAFLE